MALLVLAIFAVGSVSAADDIVTDSDVPVDDLVVDEVSTDDVVENGDASSDANKIVNTRYDENVAAGSDSSTIDAKITAVHNSGGGNLYFAEGNYSGISIHMKSNVNLIGNNSRLIGTGSSHVINLPNNLTNFTISGFIIDVNNGTGKYSAIYGSFITNGVIANNVMFNGANGVNINKYYDNMTVENNIIYDMNNDGISFANPIANSNIGTLGHTYISGNNIQYCAYGIFIGGNFKGNITSNYIGSCDCGVQILGKPNGQMGNINATIYDNTIEDVDLGIDIVNMTIYYLKIDKNDIFTMDDDNDFTILYNGNNSTILGYFGITRNILYGLIYKSLTTMTDFNNYRNGTIVNDIP